MEAHQDEISAAGDAADDDADSSCPFRLNGGDDRLASALHSAGKVTVPGCGVSWGLKTDTGRWSGDSSCVSGICKALAA